jgi:hypothetical protein
MSLARLPKTASTKYSDLSDAVDDQNNRVLSLQRRIAEAERQLRLINHENDAATAAALQEEIKRLSDKRDTEQASHLSMARTLTAVRTWLMQLSPNVELHDIATKYFAGDDERDGSTLEGSVQRCRADIIQLSGARASVVRSVLPIEALYAESDKHAEALALAGRPRLSVDKDQLTIRHSTDGFGTNPADALLFLAWLHPDTMRQRLREEVDAMRAEEIKRHVAVMPAAERKKKLAEIDTRLLALEREEEFYVCEASMYNTTVPRRENASPTAVLGVEVRRIDPAERQLAKQDAERRAAGMPVA